MDSEKETTITASPSTSGMTTSLYMGLATRQIGRKLSSNALPLTFEAAAEDQLVHQKSYADTRCALPNNTRSTFLMVFSPDGKLVASTHGDHCVYVCNVATGACVRTLSGHPRTPWCLAFHPTSSQLLASGCLGGQVRVWDLSGGSEMWCADDQTVIASLAFHPSSDRLLVIATYNELLFWDWSKPKPFAKCCTRNDKEKVRFVTFDPLGHNLITGIANRYTPPSQWDQQATTTTFYSRPSTSTASAGRDQQQRDRVFADLEMQDRLNLGASSNTESATPGPNNSASWEWTTPFSNLLQEYESLVQRCRERFHAQSDRSSTNRVDRGTNTQESGSSAANSQEASSTSTSTGSSTTATLGVAGASNRLSTYMQCIASLEDTMATTNIERLRNPLLQEPPSSAPTSNTASTSTTPITLANLTMPCSVNLGERVSEEGLRRLREMWQAGSPSANPATSSSTNTREANTEPSRNPSYRSRRRRRFVTPSFGRETKRLKTSFDPLKRDPVQRNAMNTTNAASTSTTENSTKDTTSSERERTETVSSETPTAAVGNDNLRGSIYDNPQPGTSREPEVILILSDSDSSSDSTGVPIPTIPQASSVPVIDLTQSVRNEIRSMPLHRTRLERRMRLLQMLNRTHPRTPRFLQTSQQSAFRPQTPRTEEPAARPITSAPFTRRGPTVPRFLRASADLGVRYAIRMLSRHIDLMERRCRARLEILQLEQIRRLWEEFMTQLSSLNSTLSNDSLRRDEGAEDETSTRQNQEGASETLWTRRSDTSEPGISEPNETNHQPVTSNSQNSDILDREAAAALELAYEQITERISHPILSHEDMLIFNTNSSPSTLSHSRSSTADVPELSGLNSRASLSGQVPDDATPEESDPILDPEVRPRNSTTGSNSSNRPAMSSTSRSTATTSDTSRTTSNRTGDNSEEYHSTLLRANQISVLRRLLTLLDRNDIPVDSTASPRVGPPRARLNTRLRDIPPRSSVSGSSERRPLRSGRSSPSEFLEELRSIQQSIVERYDHMPLEIPSQEAMQRDLDRIVNLEAAVRERLRLSEDTLERSFLENQSSSPLGSPWSREPPSRRRLSRLETFDTLYWGPEPSNPPRPQQDAYVGPPGGSNTFHSRLNQPFLFRPPPEPAMSANLIDERTDSRRSPGTSEEWHQNINLLQTTRRQAWRVLGLMVRHVRQHIELHQLERYSEGSALQAHLQQLLSLLHRALELTDTLLTQMLTTRREMEHQWRVRLRSTPADRPPRQFRHVWHPLERVDYFHSSFSATLAALRGHETLPTGAYAELQRRSLADTDSAVVNHLIQHFQRRTPEAEPSTSSITQNSTQEETVNSDRSQQLRQRLGGLWSCRRVPPSESQPRRVVTSSHVLSTSTLPNTVTTPRATQGPSTPSSLPDPSRPRLPQYSRTEDRLNGQSSSEVGESSPLYDSIRSRYNRVCTILDRLTQLDPSPQFRAWADNLRRLLEMPQRYFEAEDERQRSERRQSAFNVPSVRINDVPVADTAILHQQTRSTSQPTSPPLWGRQRPAEEPPSGPRQRSRSPSPVLGRVRAGGWRSWMYYPRNRGIPNSARDLFGASHQATMEGVRGAAASCPTTLTHRIQCWPFLEGNVPPDISNAQQHVVVASCRINNDASVDVSRDGRILVALVPSPRPGGHSKLGIYSLEKATLGQVLFLTPLEQSPVSVSLSPSSRFLLVGIATKRFLTVRGESSPAAQVFRLPWEKDTKKSSPAVSLEPTRFIYQASEIGYVSMNCIRWAPVSGQGMVYGTNTGNLGILR